VEAAELAEAELVRVRPLLAAHRVVGVDRADAFEQRLAAEAVVRRLVVERHAALVAPVDVDLPPVDLAAGVAGEALVAAPRRVAAGQAEREPVVRSTVVRLNDALGELPRHVVDDDEFAMHRANAT